MIKTIFILLLVPSILFASTEGPTSPGTTGDDSTVGTVAWSNTNNAKVSDNSYATAVVSVIDQNSHYLTITNFGFSLPNCYSITGITVEFERSSAGSVADNSVKLIIGGTITGNEKAVGGNWPGSDTYQTYGGSSDLWGTTPTCTQIKASNFGVGMSVALAGGVSPTANIDHGRITITYDPPHAGIDLQGVYGTGIVER